VSLLAASRSACPNASAAPFLASLALVAAALGLLGCPDRLCKSRAPAFQVDLLGELGQVTVLQVEIQILDPSNHSLILKKLARLPMIPVSPGRTSFDVFVGTIGTRGFFAQVVVVALADKVELGRATQEFLATGDACNFFTMSISGRPNDGGAREPDRSPAGDTLLIGREGRVADVVRLADLCPAGLTWCSGACVDTKKDQNHCGGCGVLCGAKTCCVSQVLAADDLTVYNGFCGAESGG